MKRIGKVGLEWQKTRRAWLKANPADYRGMWQCEICTGWFEHITLDHIKRRGSHAESRNDMANLRPLCAKCHVVSDSGMRYN